MLSSRMNMLGRQYSAIYTAGSPSKSPREHLYLGRHLLATEDVPTHFYNISSCLFFYVENITFQIKTKDKSNMTWYLDERADTNGSACSPEPKYVIRLNLTISQAIILYSVCGFSINQDSVELYVMLGAQFYIKCFWFYLKFVKHLSFTNLNKGLAFFICLRSSFADAY